MQEEDLITVDKPKAQGEVIIDLSEIHGGQAKLSKDQEYLKRALVLAGKGKRVILTGPAPVWMYLRIAHALHGKAKTLFYDSPATGRIVIFNHDPY